MDKAVKQEWAIHKRDRGRCFLLLDSGGFQIKERREKGKGNDRWDTSTEAKTTAIRERVLRWQLATGDAAVILDMPMGDHGDLNECLAFTLDSLRYTAENHKRLSDEVGRKTDLPFLNVIQGRKWEQAKEWYDAVRWFEADGIAFANYSAQNLYNAVKMLFYLIRTGELSRYRYIHFLGNGTIYVAVLFYVLSRLISRIKNEMMGEDRYRGPYHVNFTSDASSESYLAGRHQRIYLKVNADHPMAAAGVKNIVTGDYRKENPFTIRAVPFESKDLSFVRHDQVYPFATSPLLGEQGVFKYGDIICPGAGQPQNKKNKPTNLDELSYAILYANNVCLKIEAINIALELERRSRRVHFTYDRAVDRQDQNTQQLLWDLNKKELEQLANPKEPVTSVVAISAALYDLFQDSFKLDDSFENDVKRLEKYRSAFEVVFKKWFNKEFQYAV